MAQGTLQSSSRVSGIGLSSPPLPAVSWQLRAPGDGAWGLGPGIGDGLTRHFSPHQALALRPPGSNAECRGALRTSLESHKTITSPLGTLERTAPRAALARNWPGCYVPDGIPAVDVLWWNPVESGREVSTEMASQGAPGNWGPAAGVSLQRVSGSRVSGW